MTQSPQEPAGQPPRVLLEREASIFRLSFPRGALDGTTVRELYERVVPLTDEQQPHVLVDLRGVPMVTSAGLGMMVTIRKKLMQCGGQLHIVIPDPRVRREFEVMNLHLILSLFDSEEEAKSKFR